MKVVEFFKSAKYKQFLMIKCHSCNYKIICYSSKKFMSKDNCLRYKTHGKHTTPIIFFIIFSFQAHIAGDRNVQDMLRFKNSQVQVP